MDAESLRQAAVVAMVVLGLVGLIVWRVVRAVVTRMIYLGLIAALIGALWIQREDLAECQTTCACRLFGQDVAIPDAKLPSILEAGQDPAITGCHRTQL